MTEVWRSANPNFDKPTGLPPKWPAGANIAMSFYIKNLTTQSSHRLIIGINDRYSTYVTERIRKSIYIWRPCKNEESRVVAIGNVRTKREVPKISESHGDASTARAHTQKYANIWQNRPSNEIDVKKMLANSHYRCRFTGQTRNSKIWCEKIIFQIFSLEWVSQYRTSKSVLNINVPCTPQRVMYITYNSVCFN